MTIASPMKANSATTYRFLMNRMPAFPLDLTGLSDLFAFRGDKSGDASPFKSDMIAHTTKVMK
eukprot:m.57904 g.57904  ORF g.57904 m.57904 type:complete len:63 (-) comp11140_c0_seq2:177-365(-)